MSRTIQKQSSETENSVFLGRTLSIRTVDRRTGLPMIGVAKVAFDLVCGGRENGHDLDDWLQAESELVPPGSKLALVAGGVGLPAA